MSAKIEGKRLQAAPLGRPPLFKDQVTIGPVSAERRLKDALVRLAEREGVATAVMIRRALIIGTKELLGQARTISSDSEGTDNE